jgi:hypothetical protein
VLVVVVMMLFAISVAGVAGYLVVSSEHTMATQASQGSEALAVARAGLHRFAAEQLGAVGDSVSYAIGNGVALVTTRKVLTVDADTDLYHIRSEATIFDALSPATPARRVVGAYAHHQRRPLRRFAAFVSSADRVYAALSGVIDGDEHSTAADCSVGGGPGIGGAVARLSVGTIFGGNVDGSPPGITWSGGFPAVYDSVALRWDVISHTGFPVDFDGVMPNYGAIPTDSFPVVRLAGGATLGSGSSGRGLLIVRGQLSTNSAWSWEGIVLAGSIAATNAGTIRGMLVGGLNGTNPATSVYWAGAIRYYSCHVYRANESLSYLDLVEGSVYEVL